MTTEMRPDKRDQFDVLVEEAEIGKRLLITVVDLESEADLDTNVVFTRSSTSTCSTS